MTVICNLARGGVPLVVVLLLQGCTGRAIPAPISQTSPLNGRFSKGTIVAVRKVDVGNHNGSVNTIMTALSQKPINQGGPAVEIVIRRADGTVTSIVQQRQAGQPSFMPGETVAIVEAAATIVHSE